MFCHERSKCEAVDEWRPRYIDRSSVFIIWYHLSSKKWVTAKWIVEILLFNFGLGQNRLHCEARSDTKRFPKHLNQILTNYYGTSVHVSCSRRFAPKNGIRTPWKDEKCNVRANRSSSDVTWRVMRLMANVVSLSDAQWRLRAARSENGRTSNCHCECFLQITQCRIRSSNEHRSNHQLLRPF